MIERSHNTAILLFAHNTQTEAKHKQFSVNRNSSANQKIAALLLENTLKIAQSTNLPLFHSHTELQKGNTFGERLNHAFEYVFQKGFQHVIAIGSDAPQLTKQDILAAHQALKQGQQVLGPVKDGGLYLIGLSKKCVNAIALQNICWQSGRDFNNLKAVLEKVHCQIQLLRPLTDVDHFSSLQFLLRKKLLKQAITKELLPWINQFSPITFQDTSLNIVPQFIYSFQSLRAPPFLR